MAEEWHDVIFLLSVSRGARGGPVYRTEIVTLSSGAESRNARWSTARRRYEAAFGVRTASEVAEVTAFFEARQGRRFAFRWRDPVDHSSHPEGGAPTATDQMLGTGDGVLDRFDLVKSYVSGSHTMSRAIALPVVGSVLVAVDGVAQQEGADFSVTIPGGEVVFATAPAPGAVVSAGFFFDVPARFDTDELLIGASSGAGDIGTLPVIEVRIA